MHANFGFGALGRRRSSSTSSKGIDGTRLSCLARRCNLRLAHTRILASGPMPTPGRSGLPSMLARRRGDQIGCNFLHRICRFLADSVAKRSCASGQATLIQRQPRMRNADSRIHSSRFDCCAFLFYSFPAVTFATVSALLGPREMSDLSQQGGAKRTLRSGRWLFPLEVRPA